MSTHRCEHGNVVSDSVGEYRCYGCEPIGPADLRDLAEEVGAGIGETVAAHLARRDARIAELERVVAQLCERNGIAFDAHPLADAFERREGPMGVQSDVVLSDAELEHRRKR